MFAKILPFLLIAGSLAAAQVPAPQPEKPVGGQQVTWVIEEFEKETSNPIMLAACYEQDTVAARVIEGELTPKGWRFSYLLPEDAVFLAYKFEDDEKTLLNDGGLFFGLPLYDQSSRPCYDANRLYASLYLDPMSRRIDRVEELLRAELELYPMNWQALLLLRRIELQKGGVTEEEIAAELDSLFKQEPDSLEAFYFAATDFFISSPEYSQRGMGLLKACAQVYPASKYWVDYQYSIFGFLSQDHQRFARYREEVFPLLRGKAKESGYFLLANHALDIQETSEVQDLAAGFLEEFPSSELAPSFVTTMLQARYQQAGALWAADMLTWQEKYPESPEINIQLAEYYRDRIWSTALQYYRSAIKNADDSEPARLFAEAAAAKRKNFAEAGKYLRRAIEKADFDRYRTELWWQSFKERRSSYLENRADLYTSLGWLSYKYGEYQEAVEELILADSFITALGAYEETLYRRLLKASQKTGDLSARQLALLNLLLAEPQNPSFLKGLEDIYVLEEGSVEGFEEWLSERQTNLALRSKMNLPLPDFPLYRLDGETILMSENIGKVVVVNFWGTWCEPCKEEIPLLNKLVERFKANPDVEFMAISSEPPEKVKGFLQDHHFRYDQYLDPEGRLSELFEISSIPTHMVIDPEGLLQYRHMGALENIDQVLEAEIEALLSEM